jgi:hypothetical protein
MKEVPDDIEIKDVSDSITPCPECGEVPLFSAITMETPFKCQCGHVITVHPFAALMAFDGDYLHDIVQQQRDVIDDGEEDE